MLLKMKIALILCFIALIIAFVECKVLNSANPKSSQNVDLKRQPLVSPEYDSSWDEYKRIKRKGDDKHDDENESITTATNAVKRFQDFLLNCKGECGTKMGFKPNEIEKSLLFEENPTQREKCLMACVLEQTKIMTRENKISVDTIANLASMISNRNELIIAIARATADNCNRFIDSSNKCEAAFHINRCIAHGLKKHKIQIVY